MKIAKLADQALEDSSGSTPRPERVPYPRLPPVAKAPVARKWKSLLWSIECAKQHGHDGLRGLAIALSKMIIAEGLEQLVFEAREHSPSGLEAKSLLWASDIPLNDAGDTLQSLLVSKKKRVKVDMNDAIVIPDPWERWRLFGALANLGEDRQWGPWRQDKRNHYGEAWLPWPIVWVSNGNHSTMAGLVRGGGKFKCHDTLDFSPVLKAVTTDGQWWYRTDTGQPFAQVRSLAMAGIFDIGQCLCFAKAIDVMASNSASSA